MHMYTHGCTPSHTHTHTRAYAHTHTHTHRVTGMEKHLYGVGHKMVESVQELSPYGNVGDKQLNIMKWKGKTPTLTSQNLHFP